MKHIVDKRHYDCIKASMNRYREDTPEAREYYASRGFTFDARNILKEYVQLTTPFTTWFFGVNPSKRMYNSKSYMGIAEFFKLEEGVDYVVLKRNCSSRANAGQRNVLLTAYTVELILTTSANTRREAVNRINKLIEFIRKTNNQDKHKKIDVT